MGAPPLTILGTPRKLNAYSLTEHEFDDLASAGASIHSAFLGLSPGTVVSFGVMLSMVAINLAKMFAAYIGLLGLTRVLTGYFASKWYADSCSVKQKLSTIKDESPTEHQSRA